MSSQFVQFIAIITTCLVLVSQQFVRSTEDAKSADDTAQQLGHAIELAKQGKYPEAEKELRAILAIREKTLGKEHAETLLVHLN